MPELPEVEIYRRYVERNALGQRIVQVRVPDRRILRDIPAAAFSEALVGSRFLATRRHGKHLFVEIDRGGWLYLHFGMTGDLGYYRGEADPRFSKVIIDFVRGWHLAFEDARLFGRVSLVDEPDELIEAKRLGVDPLDPGFTAATFLRALRGRKGAIKAVLMSQTVVAGLGNLYVDETLYQTAIHPARKLSDIDDTRIRALHRAIRRVMKEAIDRHESGRELPDTWLTRYRREGQPCRKCGAPITRAEFFGRTTYYCSGHQR